VAAANKSASDSSLVAFLVAADDGSVSSVPGRARRGVGGELVGGVCSSSSTGSRGRLLQRRREEVGVCSGAVAAGLCWPAAVRGVAWFAPGLGFAAGGAAAGPRRRRRAAPVPEVDEVLGAWPRPMCHNDKVGTSGAPLARFTKLQCGDEAPSTSGLLVFVLPSPGARRGARRGGAPVAWRIGVAGAENPRGFGVILFFSGFFLQSVRTYVSFWTFPISVYVLCTLFSLVE
jgi:hypothetical protein